MTPAPLTTDSGAGNSTLPNPPKLNALTLENERPSVDDVSQGLQICRDAEYNQRAQIQRSAALTQVLDGRPPFSPLALRQAGDGWASNVHTGFLPSLVEKMYPRLVQRIKIARYLTAATLPNTQEFPDAAEKTQVMQEIYTKTVRGWSGWNVFMQGLAKETATYGYSFPTFLDPFNWQPKNMRGDEAFVPAGTPIMNQEFQYYVIRQDWDAMVLARRIQGETAEAAGWNITNTREAIEEAGPMARLTPALQTDFRRMQDLTRTLTVSTSYQKGWNLVPTYRLYTEEADGSTTERIIHRNSGVELFVANRADYRISDIVLPFAFQFGNGTIYGSKGIGILNYEMGTMVEKARNRAFDALANNGRRLLTCANASDAQKAQLTVHRNYIVAVGAIPANVQQMSNIGDNIEWDKYCQGIAEQNAGVFLPASLDEPNEKTATEAKINQLREDETTSVTLDNWLVQFQILEGIMRRRMFNPACTEKSAVLARQRILSQGISESELDIWANEAATETTFAVRQADEQALIATLTQAIVSDPDIDKIKAKKELYSLLWGTDLMQQLLNPAQQSTQQIEAARWQEVEDSTLETSKQIIPSPNDLDMEHMRVLEGGQDAQGQYSNPILQSLQRGNPVGAQTKLEHYALHLNQAQQKKQVGLDMNVKKQFIKQMQEAIASVVQPQAAATQQSTGIAA